jgi:hypothetical protein
MSTTTPELAAICQTCHKPIAAGEGSIWIKKTDLNATEQAAREWEERQEERTRQNNGMPVYSALDLSEYPDEAHWRVSHHACSDTSTAMYSFEVQRCSTWAELVHWTAHLMEKDWLRHTDWSDMLRETSDGSGSRLRPAVKPVIHP